jgi:hypothetical protein
MYTYSRNHRGRTVGFVFIGIAGFAAITAIIMLLWNWLIPAIFSGPVVTYWQAAGVLILSKILFSGFWGHRRTQSDYRYRVWRKRFEEKMKNISDEDRERFKEKFRHRSHWHEHCCDDKPGEKKEDTSNREN